MNVTPLQNRFTSVAFISFLVICACFAPAMVSAQTFTKPLVQGSSGSEVIALQHILISKGFLTGNATGYFGALTKKAVMDFQVSIGLAPGGGLGPITRTALNSIAETLSSQAPAASSCGVKITGALALGSHGQDVTNLQKALVSLGLLSAEPSGYFGKLTEAALKAFQKSKGLDPVGSVGPKTRAALASLVCSSTSQTSSTTGNSSQNIGSSTLPYYGGSAGSGAFQSSTPGANVSGQTNVTPVAPVAPVIPVITAPVYGQGPGSSSLGMNLSPVAFFTSEEPFINLFKESMWETQTNNGVNTGELNKLAVDVNGYPTCICGSNLQPVTFTRVTAKIGFKPGLVAQGQYIVLYDGEGTLTYGFDAVKNNTLSAPGRDVIIVAPNAGILLNITATDPNHTGNYVRNIRVVRSDQESLLAAGEIYNPVFINVIKPFGTLRFMDWSNVNHDTSSSLWSDRPTLSSASWSTNSSLSGSVPMEVMVALANKTSANAWFNMPTQASDEFITNFATYARNNLNSNQKVYVEYGNEVWNGVFAAAEGYQMYLKGKQTWPSASDTTNAEKFSLQMSYYGMRASQICEIWKSVWGAQSNRVVCAIGGQTGNTGVAQSALNCSLWDQKPCAKNHGIDVLVGNAYTGYPVPVAWTNDPDGGLGKVFKEMNDGGADPSWTICSPTVFSNCAYTGGMIQRTVDNMIKDKAIATQFGLQLVGYEGGQSLVDFTTPPDQRLVDLYIAANRDPRMGTATSNLLQRWFAAGGPYFNYFNDVFPPGKFGSWGALEHIASTTSYKYDALLSYVANPLLVSNVTSPSGTLAAGTTQSTLSASTNKNASCAYSTVQGSLFASMTPFASTGGTLHTNTLSNLHNGTSYTYYVVCKDGNGATSPEMVASFAVGGSNSTSFTFIGTGSVTGAAQGSTLSATGINLGTPSANRRVIVALQDGLIGAGKTITNATIAGIPATVHIDQNNTGAGWDAIVSAVVPTGTTGDVVITFSGGTVGTLYYSVYTADNSTLSASPTTGTGTVTSGTAITANLSQSSGGFVVGVTGWGSGGWKGTIAVPGYTIDNPSISAVSFFDIKSIASGNAAAAVTTNWTTGNYTGETAVIAWGLGSGGAQPTGDTIAPSVPSSLSASAISASQINLSWSASTDNVGVVSYKIFRNGTQIGTSNTTTYSDTGLTASTQYSYTVTAVDAAANASSQSSAAMATTTNGTTPPPPPPSTDPVVAYVTKGTFTVSGSTLSATGVSIGTASNSRRVIVVVSGSYGPNRTMSSATIGGVSSTIHADVNSLGSWAGIFSAVVPSGTTGDIAINASSALGSYCGFGSCSYAVYTVDNSLLNSQTPTVQTSTDTSTSATSESIGVSASAGGFLVGGIGYVNASSKASNSIVTGATQDVSVPAWGGYAVAYHTNALSTGNNTVTTTWTTGAANVTAVAAWR